jgi:hypothetical protein
MRGIFTLFILFNIICTVSNAQNQEGEQTRFSGRVEQTNQNNRHNFSASVGTLTNAVAVNETPTSITINAGPFGTTGSTNRSQFLILSQLGFTIPENAIIGSITVNVVGRASLANTLAIGTIGIGTRTNSQTYNPLGSGTSTGVENNGGYFSTTEGTISVEVPLSTFGTSLTPAQVNDPNFAVVLQLQNYVSSNANAFIDQISITISYLLEILPVEFISFDAKKVDNGVQLTWKVGVEVDVDRYEVERSTNGAHFTKIGYMPATQSSSYSFTDLKPLTGTAYYRVRNVDRDGQFKYTTVVKYSNNTSDLQYKAFPTTTKGQVTFQHPSATGKAAISVHTLEGRTVRSVTPAQGSISTPVDLSTLPSGTYLLQYQGENGRSEAFRIIKQ